MVTNLLDRTNAEFWNELCGSTLARALRIAEPSPENLRRFDEAYLQKYPYLEHYIATDGLRGKRVLEIGLGYGTLGQLLAGTGCRYHGLDIAMNPVALMRFRLSSLGQDAAGRIQVGSALVIPYRNATFDYVYSIGCLHHTGDVEKAVSEVHRVLVPGGTAVVMLYNRHSLRRLWSVAALRIHECLRNGGSTGGITGDSPAIRALYDTNAQGEAAPHTDFISRAQARRLFRNFRTVHIDSQNFDRVVCVSGRLVVPRTCLLNNLARLAGLDLYITASK